MPGAVGQQYLRDQGQYEGPHPGADPFQILFSLINSMAQSLEEECNCRLVMSNRAGAPSPRDI